MIMAGGGVRHRSLQISPDLANSKTTTATSPSESPNMVTSGSSSPSRMLFFNGGGTQQLSAATASTARQRPHSRSPRSSPNNNNNGSKNPYAVAAASAPPRMPCLIYTFLGLSLAVAALLLQTSTWIPAVGTGPLWSNQQHPNSNNTHPWLRKPTTTVTDPQNAVAVDSNNNKNPSYHMDSSARYHRVSYLDGIWDPNHRPRQFLGPVDDATIGDTTVVVQQDDWQPHHEEHCLPKAEWQIHSNPNCNTIHEISVASAAARHQHGEESLSVLGEGWFRTTWQLDRLRNSNAGGSEEGAAATTVAAAGESVVLKALRIEREFLSEYYELHRRDAVAMERLTGSAFVVDVFGYCGQSAINELANFPFPGILNLETFNRRMRGQHSPRAYSIKLRMAASIALGLADIHAGGSSDPDDDTVYMAHYDLNPRNIALFAGGRPKINDFNIAEFLRYDPATNATCKFPSRLHEPWWRAPEEMNTTHAVMVDEKVDVYALGNILYHTLTTHSGRGKQKKERMPEVRPLVAAGIRPEIPDIYTNSTDPNVIAMVKAIDLCWAKDPDERGTAEEVAAILYEALLNIRDQNAAAVQESEMQKQETADGDENSEEEDDDTIADAIEDKDALAHSTA